MWAWYLEVAENTCSARSHWARGRWSTLGNVLVVDNVLEVDALQR
jgi:hypothetical protein